jgi:hypothetical protein
VLGRLVQPVRTVEEIRGRVVDQQERYLLAGGCHLFQLAQRRLGRGAVPPVTVKSLPNRRDSARSSESSERRS